MTQKNQNGLDAKMIVLNDVTGVLICGGQSKRFGTDKRFYKFKGETLFEISFRLLKSVCKDVICVFRNDVPQELRSYPILFDDLALEGPMAAMCAALNHIQTKYMLCLPCDMPQMTPQCLNFIATQPHDFSVVVPKTHQLHPLVGRYSKDLYFELKSFGLQKSYGLSQFILSTSSGKRKILEASFWKAQGISLSVFENFNVPGISP